MLCRSSQSCASSSLHLSSTCSEHSAPIPKSCALQGPGTLSPLTQAPIGNAEKQIPQIDAVSGFEDVHVHRFTDDGRYLICFSRNQHDLVVYRFKGFGAEPLDDAEGATEGPPVTPSRRPRAGATTEPQTENDKTCEKQRNRTPSPATTRDLYFQLQYQRPLTVDADLLARDFAVTVLDGDYLLLASSTPAEAPPRGDHATAERSVTPGAGGNGNPSGANAGADTQGGGGGGGEGVNESDHTFVGAQQLDEAALAARASGALAVQRAREEAEADTASRRGAGRPNTTTTLPGSPTMDTVALHLVRLSDGKVCDRRVYRDDYVRLRRAAAVSVHRETNNTCLVSVLSLRWQAFRMLRIVRRKGETERAGRVDEIPGQTTENETETLDNSGAPLYTDDLETAVFTDARSPVGAACEPDDDAPLAAQDAAEREWRLGALADDDGSRQNGASGSAEPSTSGHRDVGGWSDPESHMYAGIKQKLMTRVLLEARRRDAAEAAETADRVTTAATDCIPTTSGHETNTNSSRGVKRSREDPVSSYVPSVSAPLSEKETMLAAIRNTYSDNGVVGTGGSSTPISSNTPTKTKEKTLLRRASFSKPKPPAPRNAFTSAFFSRYWSYAEWMVLWHVQLLDGDKALLRFGTAEDVLAWGTRRSRAEFGAHLGSERCPESVLVAVMRWTTGEILNVGDAAGMGGVLLGVPPEVLAGTRYSAAVGSSNIVSSGAEGGVPGEPAPPQAEGSVWQRLASGAGGVGGPVYAGHAVGASQGPSEHGGTSTDCMSNDNTDSPDPNRQPTSRHQSLLNKMDLAPGFRWPSRPSSQGHWSPSPYFDARYFRYDQRAIAPDERPRPAPDVSLKFTAATNLVRAVERRVRGDGNVSRIENTDAETNDVDRRALQHEGPRRGSDAKMPRAVRAARFTFPPSRTAISGTHARVKRTVTHVFHPVYPFAMSISQAFMQPQVVSFHLRWGAIAK